MLIRFLALLLLCLASPAIAADLSGRWALKVGDTTIFNFEIVHTADGWTGRWTRPTRFSLDLDGAFSKVAGPPVSLNAAGAQAADGAIELSFDDPKSNIAPVTFRFRALDDGRAEAAFLGSGMEPLPLVRDADMAPIGPWDPQRVYSPSIERPTNAEMTAIFQADQDARKDWATADRQAVAAADRRRRARTLELIDTGALHSGDDFYHAAFVFQHGEQAEDYLKAHILATIAIARGNGSATWIAAATLDRYLQSIGRPQVFGTQFQIGREGAATQEPYARDLLSDALRRAMRVPPQAEQERQRERLGSNAASKE